MNQKDKFYWMIMIGALMWIVWLSFFAPTHDVDIDCLLDMGEDMDLYNASYGYLHDGLTVKQIKDFYWFKHPKSRILAKSGIGMILDRCTP